MEVMNLSNLLKDNKELMKEYYFKKNKDVDLDNLKPFSSKKIWWKCKNGHEWKAVVSSRSKGHGCPYCNNLKALAGYNDLATTSPELLKIWNYKENNKRGLFPKDFTKVSGKKVWWVCPKCSFEWEATIAHIAYGRRCPHCNTGKQTSFSEQAIYYYLSKVDETCVNRYKVNGKNELDIYLPKLRVGIEYYGYRWH